MKMNSMWWNAEKIEWYERASSYSAFHRTLKDRLEAIIPKEKTILELGCGLGHTAEALKRDRYTIEALDIDKSAILTAEKRSRLSIFSVEDYRETKRRADIVLTLFFGRIWDVDNLTSLLSLCNEKLISVYSLHKGQNESINARKTHTKDETLCYLNSLGLTARAEEMTIPFHQPLKSMEEAKRFILSSYPDMDTQLYTPYIEKTDNSSFPFLFKNEKRIVITEIWKNK